MFPRWRAASRTDHKSLHNPQEGRKGVHMWEKRSHGGIVLLGQACPPDTPIQACGWQHGPSWSAQETFLYSVPSDHCKLAATKCWHRQ